MPVSTTPGQRFTQLIQQLGLTKNAFAQSLGKTATVIQHIVDERNKPGYDLLNRVCEVYPNVASEWLLRGLGPMLRDQSPAPLFKEATPAPVPGGIDLSEVPHAPRRRAGNLLQPEDITATLALAGQPPNGSNGSSKEHSQPARSAGPIVPAVAAPPHLIRNVSAPAAPEAAPVPMVAASAVVPAAAAPSAPAAPAPLPDPAYLAALFQTQQLQHQLALAEQRNQYLLEQQALLQQMVELLQR